MLNRLLLLAWLGYAITYIPKSIYTLGSPQFYQSIALPPIDVPNHVLTVFYCQSCQFIGAVRQLQSQVTYASMHGKDLVVDAIPSTGSPFDELMVGLFSFILDSFVFLIVIDFCGLLGERLKRYEIVRSISENKIAAFVLCNLIKTTISNYFKGTGDFEIFLGQKQIWSTKKTHQFPTEYIIRHILTENGAEF